MAAFSLWATASVVLLGLSISTDCQEINLVHHLEHLDKVRNPTTFDKTSWFDTKNYIFDQLRSYSLITKFHRFNTSVNDNNVDTTVTGNNIVGIAKGPEGGPVILIGADYDTGLLQESPMEDNGSGVAAMLEAARNYMGSIHSNGNYTITGTVIFVAFDINTREYDGTATGKPGSYYFLHQFLWPYLQQSSKKFTGAVILDSISKYNMEEKSQVLPTGFENVFPEASADIVRRGYKGDFLALITRQSKESSRLSQAISDHYNKDRKSRMFRLLDLVLKEGAQLGETFNMINHQSHYHFWTFQPSNESIPLPAILLTDTDIHRKPSDSCSKPCTASQFLTRSKRAFITKTVETVVQTLASLQTYRPNIDSSGTVWLPSMALMALLATMGQLCQ